MRTETAIAWIDSQIAYCTCDDRDCAAIHTGDDLLPARFAFWVVQDRKGTYQTFDSLKSFTIELTDMAEDDPFQAGEAVVKDLATGDQMDAAEWMAR